MTAEAGNSGPSTGSPGSTGRMIQRNVRMWLFGTSLDEVGDIVVGRCPDDLLGAADLDDLAVTHDHDVIAELERLGEVVGDEHHGLADLVVEAQDLVLHVAPDERVERAERLVEEHDLGIHGEGPGQPDPLLHAARQLVGIAVGVALQPDEVDHRAGPLLTGRLRLAADLEAERDVVHHPPVRAAGRSAGRPC